MENEDTNSKRPRASDAGPLENGRPNSKGVPLLT
jgi:hypothetical protein